MNSLEELLRAAGKLQVLFLQRRWHFCFIGGVAVQRWGNPRFTQDIDLTLLTGFGEEQKFVDVLLGDLNPRRADARAFALQNRVLLGRTHDGVDVDIALGALPFEERSVSRSTPWNVREGVVLTTCSAEDLVVHKTFAGRGRDWADVETVLTRQHGRLNLNLVRSELKPLLELKNEPESLQKLELMIATVERRLRTKQ